MAFEKLKQEVASPPVLALPDFSKPFLVECDALGFGIEAVSMQDHRPITFHIQALKGKSLHLSTYENKLLALATAVQKWRPNLFGRPFLVKTDPKLLKFLLEKRVGNLAQ